MKRHWLLIGVAVLTTVLALGAVACEEDEDDGDGDATATQPAGGTPADGATPTDAVGASGVVEVEIAEVDGSGVTGNATLTPVGEGFEVDVSIDGGLEAGSHASHIHQGATCTTPTSPPTAPVIEALTNIDADDGGSGIATTDITTTPLTTFEDGNSYVAVHALDGAVVGCGDIPSA